MAYFFYFLKETPATWTSHRARFLLFGFRGPLVLPLRPKSTGVFSGQPRTALASLPRASQKASRSLYDREVGSVL